MVNRGLTSAGTQPTSSSLSFFHSALQQNYRARRNLKDKPASECLRSHISPTPHYHKYIYLFDLLSNQSFSNEKHNLLLGLRVNPLRPEPRCAPVLSHNDEVTTRGPCTLAFQAQVAFAVMNYWLVYFH